MNSTSSTLSMLSATRRTLASARSSTAPPTEAKALPSPLPNLASEAAKKPPKKRLVLVRDSFTMPEADVELIALLKSTALGARRAAKKSELLRAGLHALAALDATALVAALDRLEPVAAGRPKSNR